MVSIKARGLSTRPLPSVVLFLGYLLAFCTLAACLAYWAMQIFAPSAPVASSGVVAEKSSSLDLSAASSLFGNTNKTTAATPAQTNSNIQIVGLMASRQGFRANAILAIDSRSPQAFAVGDSLGNNTRLSEVNSDGIVITKDGVRSKVPLAQRATVASLSAQGDAASQKPTGSADASQPRSTIAKVPGSSANFAGTIPPTPSSPTAPISPPVMNATMPAVPPPTMNPPGGPANGNPEQTQNSNQPRLK
jgi:type II secretory pathway component PulC